jgi:hypothetical protein
MQQVVETNPALLEDKLRPAAKCSPEVSFEWKSPLRSDDWAEYRDRGFLESLGLGRLAPKLADFWPARGPQWDALAGCSDGKVFVIEAKAHSAELVSSCKAGDKSKAKIRRAFQVAKAYFGAKPDADWCKGFYQYANRLAHLYFLREIGGVNAHLGFVYFMNDTDMRGPASRDEWEKALKGVHKALGLQERWTHPAVHDLFIDVSNSGAA